MFGSLLGAVREGDVIKGSGDIDVCFRAEDGFESSGKEAAYFGGRIVYFNYDGEPRLNCQVLHKINGKYYFITENLIQGGWEIEGFTTENFGGNTWKIPKNYEKLLTEWYGEDWRTPKKGIHATLQNYILTPTTKENEQN